MTNKKTKPPTLLDETPHPNGAERFTATVTDVAQYPYLSVHNFDGVRYRVVALLVHTDGVSVEFVRMP